MVFQLGKYRNILCCFNFFVMMEEQSRSQSLDETYFVSGFFLFFLTGFIKSTKSCKFYLKPIPHKSASADFCGWPEAGRVASFHAHLTVHFL